MSILNIEEYITITDAAKLIHRQTGISYIEIARLFKQDLTSPLPVYHINEVLSYEVLTKSEKRIALKEAYSRISKTGLAESLGYQEPNDLINRILLDEHPHWYNAHWLSKDFFNSSPIKKFNLKLKPENEIIKDLEAAATSPLLHPMHQRKFKNAVKIIEALYLMLQKPIPQEIENNETSIKILIQQLAREALPKFTNPHSIAAKIDLFVSNLASNPSNEELRQNFPKQETIAKWLK